jgi:hypothetical protein
VYEPAGKEKVKSRAYADALHRNFRGRSSKLHGNPFFCRVKEVTYVFELLDFRTQKAGAAACILQGPSSVGKSKIVLEALDRLYQECPESGRSCSLLVSEGSHAVGVAFGVVLHLLQQIFVHDEPNTLLATSADEFHGTSKYTGLLSSRFQRTISGPFLPLNSIFIFYWSPVKTQFSFCL